MKYFFGTAVTTTGEMEWSQNFVVPASTIRSAFNKAERECWTHHSDEDPDRDTDFDEEQFKYCTIREIPCEHYLVLKEYLIEVPFE